MKLILIVLTLSFMSCSTTRKIITTDSLDLSHLSIPYGYPEDIDNLSTRVDDRFYGDDSDLLIVNVTEKSDKYDRYSFYQISNLNKETGKVKWVTTGNSKLWSVSTKYISSGHMRVLFHSCTECSERYLNYHDYKYSKSKGEWVLSSEGSLDY